MADGPKYPEIEVQLTGVDSNAFSIIGTVDRALREAGVSAVERNVYMEESMSGDWDNVIETAMRWVEVS